MPPDPYRLEQRLNAALERIALLEDRPVYVPSGLTPAAAGAGGATDHGLLTGLGDDDHAQYHNNTRGDARYWQLATDLATQAELDAHLNDTADAHDATAISYAGGTGMSAADVEAAIDELANEKANLASPVFTGNPTAPTPGTADNDTSLATTAMVQAAISAGGLGGSGIELAFVQFTTDITVSGSEASPTEVVTSGQITYDGTPIWIEFFCAAMATGTTAGDQVICNLFDVNTDLGRIALAQTPAAAVMRATGYAVRRITPSAGDHTYRIRAWKAGTGNGTLYASSALNFVPGFIRITKV